MSLVWISHSECTFIDHISNTAPCPMALTTTPSNLKQTIIQRLAITIAKSNALIITKFTRECLLATHQRPQPPFSLPPLVIPLPPAPLIPADPSDSSHTYPSSLFFHSYQPAAPRQHAPP